MIRQSLKTVSSESNNKNFRIEIHAENIPVDCEESQKMTR